MALSILNDPIFVHNPRYQCPRCGQNFDPSVPAIMIKNHHNKWPYLNGWQGIATRMVTLHKKCFQLEAEEHKNQSG